MMADINVDSKADSAVGQSADANEPVNPKEKTSMCLINELSRFNKLKHQYTLVDEQGPAHKKTFFVQLKLGDEEYNATEGSIKRAQQLAAQQAIAKTKYPHPPPKQPKEALGPYNGTVHHPQNTITPTVELNALAMKRGEKAEYTPIEMTRNNYTQPQYECRYPYNPRRYPQRPQRLFCVSLRVGNLEFIGEGFCRQRARHNAAEKALKLLRTLPVPNREGKDGEDGEHGANDLKSEISLVHELALRRKLPISFQVISESGPPHQRTFTTECAVGDFKTTADGNSKKNSKREAAILMLEEIKKMGPLPAAPIKNKPKNNGNKKKNRNLIKAQKAAPYYGQNVNPISRLIQIQQAKKEREPEFKVIEEKGLPRRREFVIQVEVNNTSCSGVGPNKKLAKRAAAEAMLQLLGYSKSAPQPDKPSLKTNKEQITQMVDKKVTFVEPETGGTTSLQIKPGLIAMPESLRQEQQAKWKKNKVALPEPDVINVTSSDAKPVVSYQKQLAYLGSVLRFQVQFTDFPNKDNENEFLSLCSLNTDPPTVSHGAGMTIEAAHDAAAKAALHKLSNPDTQSSVKCD